MIGRRDHHDRTPLPPCRHADDWGDCQPGCRASRSRGATMMVAWRDRDAGTVVAGDGDAPSALWTDRHFKKHVERGFLAGADGARNGAVPPISGIYWQRGAPGGGGGGRRGRGAGVSGTCKLVVHDSPSIKTSAAPVHLWVGGLYGRDLRSGKLAVLASAVLIASCCHTRARPRQREFGSPFEGGPQGARRCKAFPAARRTAPCPLPGPAPLLLGGGCVVHAGAHDHRAHDHSAHDHSAHVRRRSRAAEYSESGKTISIFFSKGPEPNGPRNCRKRKMVSGANLCKTISPKPGF